MLERLHDLVIIWLVVILFLVFVIAGIVAAYKSNLVPDSLLLEQSWTLVPMLILVRIAYPSIHLLCLQDSLCALPYANVKVIANQWNWQSERMEVQDHLLDRDKLDELSSFDYPIVFAKNKIIRVVVTRRDVLHSLGLPSLSLKLDATPGRLNATTLESVAPGLLQGSCFELCGSGHRAIPIYAIAL